VARAPGVRGTIPATGFCIHVRRRRQEQRDGIDYPRTVGDYQCYWNGTPIRTLRGQMVERGGPGDNTTTGVEEHRRIAPGRYPLAIHAGTNYRTYGYASDGLPLPGLALHDTDQRTTILIHPAHHRNGYLSSIGCLNPAIGLVDADSCIDIADSRRRVIAIIDAVEAAVGDALPKRGPIPEAVALVEGDP
jgi:hypothetical protein